MGTNVPARGRVVMGEKLVLLDGYSLMYRAFHALSTPMTAPDGTPTNAVHGFMMMLLRVLDEEAPTAAAVAFDVSKRTFRTDLYDGYKADRKPMPEELRQRLTYTPYQPRWPEDLVRGKSMIDQIRQKDRLLCFPYDTIDPFLQLLEEAAERPDVASINITIYRLASTSKIARILCRAAENGKEVLALMELRARFDEQNNIDWSERLEDAGCTLIYGFE